MKNNRRFAAWIFRSVLPVMVVGLFLLMLAGCQTPAVNPVETDPIEQTQPVTLPPETEPTEPPPTAPADGNPDDATCKGSYSVSNKEFLQVNKNLVATMGEDRLTNAQLQIYYRTAINSYRAEGHEINPDYNQPLDVQLCPIDDSVITWQQYFLQRALDSWRSYVAMDRLSQTTVFATEEAYQPVAEKHEKNLKADMPALKVLYGYNMEYRLNTYHQKYLDNLPQVIEELAAKHGYKDAHDLLKAMAGLGIEDEMLLEYAQLANKGYMLLTALSYDIEPTEEEISAFFDEHEQDYAAAGISREAGYDVDMRHILIVPENATVAEDGTVTAAEQDWDAALTKAQSILNKWKKNKTEIYFSELAYANSADIGSNVKGGLYNAIAKGQMTDSLDAWLFDAVRQPGDVEILKSPCGYHIVYFSEKTDIWYSRAEKDLIRQQLIQCVDFAVEIHPMEVDYGAIRLNDSVDTDLTVSTYDFVYPDIGHERFPVAPLYFQQDYPETMYGNFNIVTYGCGVTTMSMLTSYMTDEEWTPPEMCALYGRYASKKGTAHAMFSEVPADMNYHVVKRVYNWPQALEALEAGYMVVTLQGEGFWTRGGHYLLLHNLTEDGKLEVRDSNVLNYGRLEGHSVGYFEPTSVPGASRSYWIYEKKVTRIPTCARCGEGEENLPLAMFNEDYFCPKCQEAMHRRESYVSACAGMN